MIKSYVTCWKNFIIYSKSVSRIFEYLDRFYLKHNNMAFIGSNLMKRFKERVHDAHAPKILAAVIEQIQQDRDGNEINIENLKIAIQSYVEMGLENPTVMKLPIGIVVWQGDKNLHVYETSFEAQFLQATQVEFERKANNWNSQKNCPEYLITCDQALQHEEKRADFWLQSETKGKVLKKVETELITKKAEAVVHKDTGCKSMFQKKALDELSLMYRVFKRDETTFKLIVAQMCPYIEGRGNAIVEDETLRKNPKEFTAKLLAFKQEIDTMIEVSFQQQLPFQLGRDNSFQTFINTFDYSPYYIQPTLIMR